MLSRCWFGQLANLLSLFSFAVIGCYGCCSPLRTWGSFSSQALERPCRWSNWQLILLESWDQCCSIWATYLPSTSQRCSSISKLLICLFCFFFFVHIFFSNNNILKCNPLRAHVPSSLTVLQEETQEEQVQEPFSVLQTILCSSIFARV